MVSRDFVGGAAAIVIGAFYLSYAYAIRATALDDSVGPAGMPKAYGWILVGLGALLCAGAVLRMVQRGVSAEEWKGQGRRIGWAAGLLCFGIAYLLVVEALGYLLSMILLIAGVVVFHGERPSLRLAAISVGGAIVLWAVFVLVLGVSMPKGLLSYVGL